MASEPYHSTSHPPSTPFQLSVDRDVTPSYTHFSQPAPFYHYSSYPSFNTSFTTPFTPFPPSTLQPIPNSTSHQPPTAQRAPLAPSQPPSLPDPIFQQPQPSQRKRRKPAKTQGKRPSKRSRTNENERPADPLYSVNPVPVAQPEEIHSSDEESDATENRPVRPEFTFIGKSLCSKPKDSSASASDIWFNVTPVASKERPQTFVPLNSLSKTAPPKDSTKFIACNLCDLKKGEWRAWAFVHGQTRNIRQHLVCEHWSLYREIVILNKLKGWEKLHDAPPTLPSAQPNREPFMLDGFLKRLIKWVAVDDQSLNVVDSPEFRDLLLFLSKDIQDHDVPHRTKFSELLVREFKAGYDKMVEEMQNCPGRISFTSDVWSAKSLDPYLAITAHYSIITPSGRAEPRNQLVAFRRLVGSHTGKNMANVFFDILKDELKVLHKICVITLDNASNNDTMMEWLETLLRKVDILFDRNGNRIRCFPHIVNIAVKTGLKYLTTIYSDGDFEVEAEEIEEIFVQETPCGNEAYAATLTADVVKKARSLVVVLRASGQRRDDLIATILNGNKEKLWGLDKDGEPVFFHEVIVLLDVDTRWSSTFLMIDRVLELYPAIQLMLEKEKYADLASQLLTATELEVLGDIRRFLHVFHLAQAIVSADKTPTLSVVIPIYERLLIILADLKNDLPNLKHAITAAYEKLEHYLKIARKNHIYVLAMLLNPAIKLEWAEKYWTKDEFDEAKKSVQKAMLERQRAIRLAHPEQMTPPLTSDIGRKQVHSPSKSARAQASGLRSFNALGRSFSSGSVAGTSGLEGATNLSPLPCVTISDLEQEIIDQAAADAELETWLGMGVITDEDELEDFDLQLFWQKTVNRKAFPLLYQFTLDVLPVQASAVPCERVFSSSKETDSARRANLSPAMMEAFQILKYLRRAEQLDFVTGRLATEEECVTVMDMKADLINSFVLLRDIEGITELIRTSHEK